MHARNRGRLVGVGVGARGRLRVRFRARVRVRDRATRHADVEVARLGRAHQVLVDAQPLR